MSYQFDASTFRAERKVKVGSEISTARLLTRRMARQSRRAQRAI